MTRRFDVAWDARRYARSAANVAPSAPRIPSLISLSPDSAPDRSSLDHIRGASGKSHAEELNYRTAARGTFLVG